jgi:hypothetical protein
MSIIVSIGKPIWGFRLEYSRRMFRIAGFWFSLIVIDYDFDSFLGRLLALKKEWETK